jgi:outer membrane protein assembly factor BamD (BamD/ComL family)
MTTLTSEARMRNVQRVGMVALIGIVVALAGCADQQKQQQQQSQGDLKSGYQSLDQKQYDQAMAQADAYLHATPSGAGTAEALYLKGRALAARVEDGKSTNPDADWQAARVAYVNALQQKPAKDLEANIRAGIANVAYFQDDFGTAQQ